MSTDGKPEGTIQKMISTEFDPFDPTEKWADSDEKAESSSTSTAMTEHQREEITKILEEEKKHEASTVEDGEIIAT